MGSGAKRSMGSFQASFEFSAESASPHMRYKSSHWTKSRSAIYLDQFSGHLELKVNDRAHISHVYIWKSNPRFFEVSEAEGS